MVQPDAGPLTTSGDEGMYLVKRKILRLVFKLLRKNPAKMPMVKYWKTSDHCEAKVMTAKDGSTIMKLEGEDEPFPGFPRGHLLFGSLSKLKHEIKTQLFNESWWMLEDGKSDDEVIQRFKQLLVEEIAPMVETAKYDMLPSNRMPPCTREIWRTFEVLESKYPENKGVLDAIKQIMTFVLTEDDAYRFRLQWIVQVLGRNPVKNWEIALQELEVAEVVGDMKERVQLFRRITLVILKDKKIKQMFEDLCKEMDWKKLRLTKADKYHLRGKYFKVDLDKFEY